MRSVRPGYVEPLPDGRYAVRFPPVLREVVRIGIGQARELVLTDDPSTQRLFPPAHPDDEALEDEWRRMMAGELIESRLAAFDVVEETVDAEELDGEQLERWMFAVNAVRLVIGTILDVQEDDDGPLAEPGTREAALEQLYDLLTLVLGHITAAAQASLEIDDDG